MKLESLIGQVTKVATALDSAKDNFVKNELDKRGVDPTLAKVIRATTGGVGSLTRVLNESGDNNDGRYQNTAYPKRAYTNYRSRANPYYGSYRQQYSYAGYGFQQKRKYQNSRSYGRGTYSKARRYSGFRTGKTGYRYGSRGNYRYGKRWY